MLSVFQKMVLIFSFSLIVVSEGQAGFTLNFTPDNTGVMSTCAIHGQNCSGPLSSQTPFLVSGSNQLGEVVVDPDTGLDYYHIIVGSLADGFIQEVYIERGFTSWQGGPGTAVGGAGGASGGNGTDPLDVTATDSATAEANPRRVLMRQIVTDSVINMEFLKDQFGQKPVFTQALNTSDIDAAFMVDLSNSTYSDISTPGAITYSMSLLGVDAPSDNAQFDLTTDVQNSFLNAGLFTYTNGSGPGESAGTYSYTSGTDFNLSLVKWEEYYNSSDISNVWSYTTNQPP